MTDDEIKQWNDLRLELFAGVKMPDYALAAVLHDLRKKNFDRAMRALPIYRAKRPYKGFYAVDWDKVYDQTSSLPPRDGTDRPAAPPAARPWEEQEREKADKDKRDEVRRFLAISAERREEAAKALAHLGWPQSEQSRAWRMLVILWDRGEDVSGCYHPTKLCRGAVEEKRQVFLTREERIRELEALIKGSTWELERLKAGGAA